mgnify:CR=1 FL=1
MSDKVKQISERWANGEITSEQMKKEVMLYINDFIPAPYEYIEDK